jgi:hypothetical protein
MAISTMDALQLALQTAQRLPFTRAATFIPNSGRPNNGLSDTFWSGNPGVGPLASISAGNTAVVGGSSPSAGFGGFQYTNPGGSNKLYLAGVQVTANHPGVLMVMDRIATWRGLSTVGANAITLGVPAGPDERNYDGGKGVEAFLEIYTNPSITASYAPTYTNSAGTGSRVGAAVAIAAATAQSGTVYRLPLASGDQGIRSVQSIAQGTAAANNNAGIVLAKTLAMIPVSGTQGQSFDFTQTGLVQIPTNAGLCCWFVSSDTSGTDLTYGGVLTIIEG